MNALCRNRLLKDRRGSTAVEFAMIMPLMATLMIGAMEMGRYFFAFNSLSSATEQLARYAMVQNNPTTTQLTTQFGEYLIGDSSDVTLTFTTEVDAVTGLSFQVVDVTMPHEAIIPFVDMGTMTLRSRMRTPLPPA